MTAFVWAALGLFAALGMTALGDLVSEEVRDRLDHLPKAILRLAARRIDPAQRITLYEEVWLPDLAFFLKGDEARPATRLIHGTSFALGILLSARRIGDIMHEAALLAESRPDAVQPRLLPFLVLKEYSTLSRIIHSEGDSARGQIILRAVVDRELIEAQCRWEALTEMIEGNHKANRELREKREAAERRAITLWRSRQASAMT